MKTGFGFVFDELKNLQKESQKLRENIKIMAERLRARHICCHMRHARINKKIEWYHHENCIAKQYLDEK